MNIKQMNYMLLVVCAFFAATFGVTKEESRRVEQTLRNSLSEGECLRNCVVLYPRLIGFKLPGETRIGLPQIWKRCQQRCNEYRTNPNQSASTEEKLEVKEEYPIVYNPRGPVDQYSCQIACMHDKRELGRGIRESKKLCRNECASKF